MLLFILRQIFRIIASFLGCSETNSWGPNCTTPCNCGVGASSCDPIVGCVCQQGWNGTLCDTNINECLTSPCNASQVCVDNPGSYTCTCSSGFQSDRSNSVAKYSINLQTFPIPIFQQFTLSENSCNQTIICYLFQTLWYQSHS